MKMCLKLAYYAFSSSPPKDAIMSTFCGFSSILLKFKPFDEFFPLQISVCVASVGVCVCVCVCTCTSIE